MPNVKPIALRQLLQVVRQYLSLWNPTAFQEDRDNWDIALQRSRDLYANKIVGIVQSPCSVVVSCLKPIGSNDGQQHTALGDLIAEHTHEIDAKRNAIDVHEQHFFPEIDPETVKDASRMPGAVIAAVADEDAFGHVSIAFHYGIKECTRDTELTPGRRWIAILRLSVVGPCAMTC